MNRLRITWSLWLASLAVLALAGCGLPSPAPGSSLAPSGIARAPSATPPSPTGLPMSPTITEPGSATAPSPTSALPSATPTNLHASAPAIPNAPSATPIVPPTVTPPRADELSATPSALPTTGMPAALTPGVTSTPASASGPQIRYFRVLPTTTQNVGDALSMEWQAAGSRAEICPIEGTGPVESWCRDVPLTGTDKFVTTKDAMGLVGLGLRVWQGTISAWNVVYVHLQCQNLRQWFFDTAPQRCPAADPLESYAAGQYFENGLMIWIAENDNFYVFYRGKDAQGFQTFDWILAPSLKPGASEDHRVNETPPAGLYEPVSGFGLIWRGEMEGVRADVRQRLGWATAPEAGFDTAYQCITPSHPHFWTCFLRGPSGEILRLSPDSTAQARFLWQEQ